MDNIDAKILTILQKDARTSVSDISSQINLSVSATAERIKKLDNSDVITKYTTVLNPQALGKELTALMLITLKHYHVNPTFLEFVKKEKDILSCYYTTGNSDYVLKIVTENTMTLEKLLSRIKNIDCVIRTNTIIVLGTEKESFSVSI